LPEYSCTTRLIRSALNLTFKHANKLKTLVTISVTEKNNKQKCNLKKGADENADKDKKNPKKKVVEEPKPTVKLNELKALELFQAKTIAPAKSTYFNMLTGNEDVSQIYSYISINPVKNSYRELLKFRKRTNYFELLTNLLQKALTEELIQEVNEWCSDTLEWMRKRNSTILGIQTSVTRKQDGVVAVSI